MVNLVQGVEYRDGMISVLKPRGKIKGVAVVGKPALTNQCRCSAAYVML